jgi:hypothetical protein
MEHERSGISTHAIMDKVREMDLYPVVPAEGRFTASKRLARAMEIAYKALSAPETSAQVSRGGDPGLASPEEPAEPRH